MSGMNRWLAGGTVSSCLLHLVLLRPGTYRRLLPDFVSYRHQIRSLTSSFVTSSGFSFGDDFLHDLTNSLFAAFSLGDIDRRGVGVSGSE
jgi:hypothetical protein